METLCQSCAMPMKTAADFGTNADGSLNKEYCVHCYQKGAFTSDTTLKEFMEKQVEIATKKLGMAEKAAREKVSKIFPTLKRWKEKAKEKTSCKRCCCK